GLDRHIMHVSKLSDILAEADYITLHVPVIAATKGLLGADEIAAMKDGVIIVNYARDLLVDEIALSAALQKGHVRRYVTDFANSVSTQMPNTIITTHLGASTRESEDNCAVMAADELKDFLENGNITNSVNFGHVDLGPKNSHPRICIFNRNVPNMIGQITNTISEAGLNIENMANKASGEVAYTLLELSGGTVEQALIDRLNAIDGIIRTRIIE
ncbi:MAG TPA: phosphoglycerate dehydrogenase, partial [Atopobiaceae bacterium]|nr:phosphoglycerate dehydrogenase [Atopobiaceae bacterium]